MYWIFFSSFIEQLSIVRLRIRIQIRKRFVRQLFENRIANSASNNVRLTTWSEKQAGKRKWKPGNRCPWVRDVEIHLKHTFGEPKWYLI